MNYTIDTGLFASNMLPPDKRTQTMTYWVKALLAGTAWLNNIALGYYLDSSGLFASDFAIAPNDSYAPGQYVYYQHAVYQRVDYSDGYVPGILPTNTDYYVFILPAPGLIGVNERVSYNGNTLTLTWALNRYFDTTFRQPVSYLGQSPLSDIYITNFDSQYQSFIAGVAETGSSAVAATISSGYVMNTLTDDPLADFSINIPAATFANITGGEKTVRAFADKYVIAGINYTVHTY